MVFNLVKVAASGMVYGSLDDSEIEVPDDLTDEDETE